MPCRVPDSYDGQKGCSIPSSQRAIVLHVQRMCHTQCVLWRAQALAYKDGLTGCVTVFAVYNGDVSAPASSQSANQVDGNHACNMISCLVNLK